MRKGWAIVAVAVLAGCGDELTPEEEALQADRDVAMVQAANEAEPPLRQVTPDPISTDDIERFDLLGEACSYAPGTSLGARVLAREADAFLKIDGEVVRLAADPGSRELPMRSRSLYSGKDYALRLQIESNGEPANEAGAYEGTVTLRDAYGRVIYEGTGPADCRG